MRYRLIEATGREVAALSFGNDDSGMMHRSLRRKPAQAIHAIMYDIGNIENMTMLSVAIRNYEYETTE
jgi:hypothetical protein